MSTQNAQPWWHYGYVWLVIAGPLVVVVASFVTLYLALQGTDPVIDDYYRKGIEINRTLPGQGDTLAPAIQARNHAATGGSKP